ncbi:unnamed protein product [Arctogadus glacialis]
MVCPCWSLVGSGPSLVGTGRKGSRESGHTSSLHMQQHSLKTEAQWSSSAAGYSQVEMRTQPPDTTRHTTREQHLDGLNKFRETAAIIVVEQGQKSYTSSLL